MTMNRWKKIALGVVLASALWMPSFANALGEVNAVSQDLMVAYTLYPDMSTSDAEAAFDSLPDWTKHVKYIGDRDRTLDSFVSYTRTLEDKTKQEVFMLRRKDGRLLDYRVMFYSESRAQLEKMYNLAFNNLKAKYGAPYYSQKDASRFLDEDTNYFTELDISSDLNHKHHYFRIRRVHFTADF